jgi:hypothetical protein
VSYWFPTAFYDASTILSIRTGSLFAVDALTYTSDGETNKFTVKDEAGGYKSINFDSCPTFRS